MTVMTAMAGEILRSPDARFEGLPDFPWAPQYVEIQGLRIHRIDEGPREARPILLLHGEPTWCFLYRKMIPALLDAGHRVIAPDLVGFGRSDKPARLDAYSYQWQVEVIAELVRGLGLRGAILFGQDWGGLVGLRVVAEDPDRGCSWKNRKDKQPRIVDISGPLGLGPSSGSGRLVTAELRPPVSPRPGGARGIGVRQTRRRKRSPRRVAVGVS